MNSTPDANPAAAAPALPRWRLRLLGGVELRDSQGRTARLPTRAATLLLARLALAPHSQHPREELAELLWPGVDGDAGRNRLRQALSVLRSLLEAPPAAPGSQPPSAPTAPSPVLHADRRAVWLVSGALDCDVDAFVQALAQGRLTEAARCYQGELLPGHFDEWVLEHRAHLAARAEALAAQVPASAFTPMPATPAPDARLPRYLTRLVGFEAAFAALAALVVQRRLVVLRGPGGAGKTRLAVEVARALAGGSDGGGPDLSPRAAAAFDLAAFVPLASCDDRAPMLDALLHVLQPQGGADTADAAQRVAGSLAGRRVLLVLDNFEQLVEAGRDDLARWLSALPQLHLLVTSRRVLGLDGETELALAALPLPVAGDSLAAHARNPSLALFVDRARAARADFELTEDNHALVTDVVRALHGLPLAIELAAARVRSLGLAEMHKLLAGGDDSAARASLALLERSGPRASDDARHASMLQVLQWSWQQLPATEQTLLAALASCDGGASLALLSQLAGLGLAAAAVRVDGLVAASVAYAYNDARGSGRYQAFEPMREFVFLRAGRQGLAQLRTVHAHALALWAASLGELPTLLAVRAEWSNLLRALASGADLAVPAASAQQAIDTVLALRPALEDLLLPPSALDHLRCTLNAARGHREALAQALLAMHSFEAGQRQAAAEHAAAAVAAAAHSSDARDRAEVLRGAARVKLRLGEDPAQVLDLIDQAVALAGRHRQMGVLAGALSTRAVLLLRRDRDLQANVRHHQEVLTLWRVHGPRERVTGGLAGLALALGFVHRVSEQLVVLDEARALAAELGQDRLLAFTHSITGYALADQRRYAESAAHYRQCLQMAWDNASWREWFYALWNLPRTLAHLRRPEPAAQLMGYAEAFYAERFGALGAEDLPEARRTRRLVAAQVGSGPAASQWQRGAALTMADAMRLALAETGLA